MGNSASEERIEDVEKNYTLRTSHNDPFFGNFTLLSNQLRPSDALIRKELVFRGDSEYQHFLKEYQKIDRKPFSLIYPKTVIEKECFQNCGTIRDVKVYFEIVGKSLRSLIQTEGIFSEVKAWFLLNEISKALQIMDEKYRRAHWAISPVTIFRNRTNNYLLYDSFFVFGQDPTHFLIEISKSNEPVTEKIKMLLQRGSIPGEQEGKQQDTYALGFVMLFAVTGILPNTLPPYPLQTQDIENIIKSKNNTLSQELVQVIKLLTHRNSAKRMDNIQLRRLLREKQADIIHQESLEYMTTRRKATSNPSFRQQRSPVAISQNQAPSKIRYNSPSYHSYQIQPAEHPRIAFPKLQELKHSRASRITFMPEHPRPPHMITITPLRHQTTNMIELSHFRLRSLDVTHHQK